MSSQQIIEPVSDPSDHLDALTLAKAYFDEAEALFAAIRRELKRDHPSLEMIERLAGLGERESMGNAGEYDNEARELQAKLEAQAAF